MRRGGDGGGGVGFSFLKGYLTLYDPWQTLCVAPGRWDWEILDLNRLESPRMIDKTFLLYHDFVNGVKLERK